MLHQIIQNQTLKKTVALLGTIIFGVGIALFAYAGTFTRYWADDYCYTAEIKQIGLFAGMVNWWHFSGNRVTALIFVTISDWFGLQAISFGPSIILILWAAAWVFFLNRLLRLLGWKIAWYWLVLLAITQVYFAVLLSPTRLQVIYWRMGSIHYTLPFPLLLFILGLLLGWINTSSRGTAWMTLANGLLAFIAAGLSETTAVLQLSILLGIFGLVLILPSQQRTRNIGLLVGPIIGTLLMLPIMLLAPANAFRQAALPLPDNKLLILTYSLRYAAEFIFFTIRGQLVPFLVFAMGIASLGFLAVPAKSASMPAAKVALMTVGTLLVTYLLIVSTFLPSAVGALAYPGPRALMPGLIILLVGLSAAVYFAVLTLRQLAPHLEQPWVAMLALFILAVFSLYPLRVVDVARQDAAQLSMRTARWDARDLQINQDIAAGQMDIVVKQTDVVQTLEDYGSDSAFWINKCAAVFYEVRSITAVP